MAAAFSVPYLQAKGAYGREANLTDWKDGKDFQIVYGPYFSIRDCKAIKAEGNQQIVFYTPRGFVAFVIDL